jgi:hypothetical protein
LTVIQPDCPCCNLFELGDHADPARQTGRLIPDPKNRTSLPVAYSYRSPSISRSRICRHQSVADHFAAACVIQSASGVRIRR